MPRTWWAGVGLLFIIAAATLVVTLGNGWLWSSILLVVVVLWNGWMLWDARKDGFEEDEYGS